MPPTVDLFTPIQQFQAERTNHPQQCYNKSTLENLKCNTHSAFTTHQPTTHHLIALLTLRWSSQPYTPNPSPQLCLNEVNGLLLLTHDSTKIIRTLFTKEANEAFDNESNAREVLAVVLQDVYGELWANGKILYRSGDREGIARRVESRIIYCISALADAHPSVHDWARKLCGKAEGWPVGAWLPDSPPRIHGFGSVMAGPGFGEFGRDVPCKRERGVMTDACADLSRFGLRKHRRGDEDGANDGALVPQKKRRCDGLRIVVCSDQEAEDVISVFGDLDACEDKHARSRRGAAPEPEHGLGEHEKVEGDLDSVME